MEVAIGLAAECGSVAALAVGLDVAAFVEHGFLPRSEISRGGIPPGMGQVGGVVFNGLEPAAPLNISSESG
jgi:hypothetical protein